VCLVWGNCASPPWPTMRVTRIDLLVELPWETIIDVSERRNQTIPHGIYLRHSESEPRVSEDGSVSWRDEVDVKFEAPAWVLKLMGTEKVRTVGTCTVDRGKRVRTARRRNIDFASRIEMLEEATISADVDHPEYTRVVMESTVTCSVFGIASAVEKIVAHFYEKCYPADSAGYVVDKQSFVDASQREGCAALTQIEARGRVGQGMVLPEGFVVRYDLITLPSAESADPVDGLHEAVDAVHIVGGAGAGVGAEGPDDDAPMTVAELAALMLSEGSVATPATVVATEGMEGRPLGELVDYEMVGECDMDDVDELTAMLHESLTLAGAKLPELAA
jgi:hypothetical protein